MSSDVVRRERAPSIDVLRGLVMAVMLLDHTRLFVHFQANPTDLASTTFPLFLTRWVTHFCAPTFVLLAGVAARIRAGRSASPRETSRYLALRGLWLVALELLVVRPLAFGNLDFGGLLAHFQVLWAIGWSMLALAALVRLPLGAVATAGIALIAGHHLLDGVRVDPSPPNSPAEWLWMVLHQSSFVAGDGPVIIVQYPLLPWIGTIAVGYALGETYSWSRESRRRALARIGAAATLAFIVLRASNLYGDPDPWTVQPRAGFTILSFLDVEKYPPSFAFLLMTLGPALLALAWLDGREPGAIGRRLAVLGSVPLFFYLLQWVAAHAASKVLQRLAGQPLGWDSTLPWDHPAEWDGLIGFSLAIVYAAWIAGLLATYPPCAAYAAYRRAHPEKRWLTFF